MRKSEKIYLALILALAPALSFAEEPEACDRHQIFVVSEVGDMNQVDPSIRACVESEQSKALRDAIEDCEQNHCLEWLGGGCGHRYGQIQLPSVLELQSWVRLCNDVGDAM